MVLINITWHDFWSNLSQRYYFKCHHDIWHRCFHSWNDNWKSSANCPWISWWDCSRANQPLSAHKLQNDWLQVPAVLTLEGSLVKLGGWNFTRADYFLSPYNHYVCTYGDRAICTETVIPNHKTNFCCFIFPTAVSQSTLFLEHLSQIEICFTIKCLHTKNKTKNKNKKQLLCTEL